MSRLQTLITVMTVTALLILPGLATAQPETAASSWPDPGMHIEDLLAAQRSSDELSSQGEAGQHRPALERNLSLVGFLDLPPEEVSDVWAHGSYAYVGGLGPGGTVKVVDISDPSDPFVVTELAAADAGGSPQDVKVGRVNTRSFRGDLLVVANDGGAEPPFGGIQLFDVTDPTDPVLLSEPRVGPVHNAYLYSPGNRAYVLLAIPFAEVFAGIFPPFQAFGDLVILDVTDPTDPSIVSDWGIGKDGGFAFGSPLFAGNPALPPGSDCTPPPGTPELCRTDGPGGFPGVLLHDIWVEGKTAYLSYWDAGLVLLDVSDPVNPTFLGRGHSPETFGSDEGELHVAVPGQGGNVVLVGDEDFSPIFGGDEVWGFLRVFDTSDPTDPQQIGAYATPNSLVGVPFPASMHNIVVRGNRAYLSWYFEGVRIVDFSQPHAPREVAAFVPDPTETSPGLFWGIYVHTDLVLASDILGGLYILELKR